VGERKNLFAGVDLKERYPLRPVKAECETEGHRSVVRSIATGVVGVLLGLGIFLVITGIEAAALVAAVHWWGLWETCLVVLLGAAAFGVFWRLGSSALEGWESVRDLVEGLVFAQFVVSFGLVWVGFREMLGRNI
jgi:hypothetical protein